MNGRFYLVSAEALRTINSIAKRFENAVRASVHLPCNEETVTGDPRIAKKYGTIFFTDEQFDMLAESLSLGTRPTASP